jgi:DNA-binding beta-propeller fold protein YncE
MRRVPFFCLLVCLAAAAQQAPIPTSTELPGTPFFVKNKWFIGGAGSWDYVTLDAAAHRLYIAHDRVVQVVDVETGTLAGVISGFRQAHAVALDDDGEYGYVSDGPAGAVDVFDRKTLKVEAAIPILCSPRSIAFEPRSKLVFAICGSILSAPPQSPQSVPKSAPQPAQSPGGDAMPSAKQKQAPASSSGASHVIAIDSQTRRVVADIVVPGDLRFAEPDGTGQVYISAGSAQSAVERNGRAEQDSVPQRIVSLDAPSIVIFARRQMDQKQAQRESQPAASASILIDWTSHAVPTSLARFLPLTNDCKAPQGLAADSQHHRLFAACSGQRFAVLDSDTGNPIASLITGPGDDVIGYDPDRELIFVANGAGYGSLTIISQDTTTDTYAVIQNLPTLARARTLAVDPSTGNVYLVTDYLGVDLTQTSGFGTVKSEPIQGSFQVLMVGH